MSFNVDISKCKDYTELQCGENGSFGALTHAIAHMVCMGAGMGEITDKNLDKCYRRVSILAHLDGAPLTSPDGNDIWITKTDIVRHVGMWTNATRQTDAQFRKMMWEDVSDRAARAARCRDL